MEEKDVLELLFADDVEFTDRPGLRPIGPEVSNSAVIVMIMLVSITVLIASPNETVVLVHRR